ncbi:hypothetical protein SO802_003693 [Lithocarpus litseifolius]|uniref:Nuclease HARBI1 n=1 Tax=Lithocarpus litseifolius TaxID=425828 RepID=A0AAW2E2J4_9ROSI
MLTDQVQVDLVVAMVASTMVLNLVVVVGLALFAWKYIAVSNFMESHRDVTYTGLMNGDIEIDSQFLETSQNIPMSVFDSPPQVETTSSTKGKRGIYPKWSTFVKTIPAPQGQKYKLFAAAQEACRKDVERAFGVLQARFAIVRGPARFFHLETLQKIMKACIILHNMIVEDERDDNEVVDLDYEQIDGVDYPPLQVLREQSDEFLAYIERHGLIRDREIHFQLQSDLIKHLWQLQGES